MDDFSWLGLDNYAAYFECIYLTDCICLFTQISSREHEHLNDLSRIAFLVIDECDRMTEQGSFPQLHSILDAVERANPMDSEDDEADDVEDVDADAEEGIDDRLHSLPGIRGEAKVTMLNDDVLAMIEQQKNGAPKPPQLAEMDDESFDDEDIRMEGDEDARIEGDELDENEAENTARRPIYRQTFVYSATLTLPPSASYIPSRNKRKKMWNLKGVQGAIEEILDKARARGQTKVIDLSNSKKQAKFNEKILESKDKPKTKKEKDLTSREKGAAPRTFNLPPGLKLQEIKCTQMHKDSHLYAYLVTTRDGAAGPSLVFCNSIKAVRRVGSTLKLLGLPVRILHANMQQVSAVDTGLIGRLFESPL
jgi:ATP-dependent RNA helicase DDX24/MAK5